MTSEEVLSEAVRAWVRQEFPAQPDAADRAAWVAKDSYTEWATMAEACGRARALVGSWMHHPAHSDGHDRGTLQLAR